ncbi:MAG: VCBS repeat-containing protein [Bacteroidia bacterium]|nr:VCBS repeat-containing protein [Bacteroidia bacterium]
MIQPPSSGIQNRLNQQYFLLILFLLCLSCEQREQSERKSVVHPEGLELARNHCQSCHMLPQPGELDKSTWRNEVLPKMGLRLGIKTSNTNYQKELEALQLFPESPALEREEWLSVMDYFIDNAPLFSNSSASNQELALNMANFRASDAGIKLTPLTTLIHFDEESQQLFIGNATEGSLHLFDTKLEAKKVYQLDGAPSDIIIKEEGYYVLSMGQVMPHEKEIGKLSFIPKAADRTEQIKHLITGLKRPVSASMADLDRDGNEDMVISSFGNLDGRLLLYLNVRGNKSSQKVLKVSAGASKNILRDWDKDGDLDIVVLIAQGDEGIYLFRNDGQANFTEEKILRFPASYGSTHFEILDLNEDGKEDILYTSGDNGDYFPVMKDFHGIRIFLQKENGVFKEEVFLPQNGVFKALVQDFDQDGDMDIASISYFPDYKKRPHESFVYYENQGNFEFKATSFPESTSGKWLTMAQADWDGDGDQDLFLGSALFMRTGVSAEIKTAWRKHAPPLFVLENMTNDEQE